MRVRGTRSGHGIVGLPNSRFGGPMPPGTFDAGSAIGIMLLDIELSGVSLGRLMSRQATVALCVLVEIGLERWIAERSSQHREPAHRVGA
jgi:hypothetical protein